MIFAMATGTAKSKLHHIVDQLSDEQAEQILEWIDTEIVPVDIEGHLRWLETGQGDPWPASRS